jgi:hypothetical protein
MRLMLCCSELGLGHVSRIIPLGKKLREKGHELFFFSGGKAYTLLRKEFSNVYPCTPVAWYENASGIVASASLINILFPLPFFNYEKNKFETKSSNAMETVRRYYDLRKHILKIKPDLVIADGDLHALRMAARWHFPAVYIANLIRPSYGFSAFLNPGERFVERYVKTCRKIIIPDNPPPCTITEYNLGNLDSIGISEKTEFVGSFLDTTYTQGSAEHVFAPISGPYGTREVREAKHLHSDAARADGKRRETSETKLLNIREKHAGTEGCCPKNRRRKPALHKKHQEAERILKQVQRFRSCSRNHRKRSVKQTAQNLVFA